MTTRQEPSRESEPSGTERWRTTVLRQEEVKRDRAEDLDPARSEVSKGHRSPAPPQRRESAVAMAPSGPEPAQENRTHATKATSAQLAADTPTAASPLPSSGE
jgi:hypothetical protein